MNTTAEQKMTQAQYIANETVVDFSKKGGQYAFLGKCVVTMNKPARVLHHYEVTPLEGPDKGRTYTLRLRFSGISKGDLSHYCDIVGKDKKAANVVHEKKAKRTNERFDAANQASKKYEAGDLVVIETSKHTWTMKVLEVDYVKGRITGVNAEAYHVGAKKAWASLTHPDVKITMKQKAAFDPRTDRSVTEHQERAAQAGAKRAATRARKQTLRSIYGF